MAKTIKFTYNDKAYTLEYTRKSIEIMERQGLKISELSDKPMTTLPQLFAGAFLAHHKFEKREVIDEIYSKMGNRDELLHTLIEMYNEPINKLMDEPEDKEGNVLWTAD